MTPHKGVSFRSNENRKCEAKVIDTRAEKEAYFLQFTQVQSALSGPFPFPPAGAVVSSAPQLILFFRGDTGVCSAALSLVSSSSSSSSHFAKSVASFSKFGVREGVIGVRPPLEELELLSGVIADVVACRPFEMGDCKMFEGDQGIDEPLCGGR